MFQQNTNIGIRGRVHTKTYTSITTTSDTPGSANMAHVGDLLQVKESALEIAHAGDNPVDLEAILYKFEKNNSVDNQINGFRGPQKEYDAALEVLGEGDGKTMADNFIQNMRKASEYRSVATPGCAAIRDVNNGTQIIVSNGNQSMAVGGHTLLDVSQDSRIYLGAGEEQENDGVET